MVEKAQEHFEKEPPHTAIKHRLFKSVYDSCISISSSFNNKNKEKRQFVYLDLYAGCGKFNDDNLGSPLIALNSSKNQLDNDSNNINKINMILSEQNTENAKHLSQNVKEYIDSNNLSQIITPIVLTDSWEICTEQFKQGLNKSDWGMIFADPFSVELKLPDLKKLIDKSSKLKDILILINTNAHERVLGRTDEESLSKIADYFGIKVKMLRLLKRQVHDIEQLNNAVVIRRLISRTFKDIDKDFVINVAITRTKEGALENADRFYLCLLTSSVGVANAFLDTYSELLNEKEQQNKNGQISLFDNNTDFTHFELTQKVRDISNNKTMSLLTLFTKLYNDFYSWKDASPNEIPTSKNIKTAINNLVEQNYLKILCTEDTKLKYMTVDGKKLKSNAFQKKQNLREIFIQN
ncbi:three-Cys-motif partner protein TcmP [bacterium]|nr:three-Cys-motif partner protein TcmP [bacterium]